MQNSQICTEIEDLTSVNVSTTSTQQDSTDNESFLCKIPLEILGELLDKYIPHEDKRQLRRVHPLFRYLYDSYIGFKVTLDNEDPASKFDFISQLAIRKTIIKNLTCDASSTSTSTSTAQPIFGEIFSYPHLLQEVQIKGNIDAHLFNAMIRHCGGIKLFEFCPGSNIKAKPSKCSRRILPEIDILSFSPPKKYYLSKCRKMKMLLNQDPLENRTDLNCEAVLSIMKSIRSPTLVHAVIQGFISDRFSVSRISLIAAEFLERNPKIESFFLGVIYEHLVADEDPISQEDAKLRLVLDEKLKHAGDILNVQKFGISTQSCDLIMWKDFLKRQHNLVHLSFTVDLVEGVYSGEMFRSSRFTLKQIIVRGKFQSAFDFTWVEDCHSLKEICLHNIEHNDHSTNMELHAVNTGCIPIELESLVLFQTVMRSDDIIVTVRRLKLKTLVLFKTGNNAGETGVNVECLKLILRCRTLQSTLLVRFVASNPMEAQELVKILQTINNGQIHRHVHAADVEDLLPEEVVPVIAEVEEHLPVLTEVAPSDPGEFGVDEVALSFTSNSTTNNVTNESKGEAILLDAKNKKGSPTEACASASHDSNKAAAVDGPQDPEKTPEIIFVLPPPLHFTGTGTSHITEPEGNNFNTWVERRNNESFPNTIPNSEDINPTSTTTTDATTTESLLISMEPNLLPDMGEKCEHSNSIPQDENHNELQPSPSSVFKTPKDSDLSIPGEMTETEPLKLFNPNPDVPDPPFVDYREPPEADDSDMWEDIESGDEDSESEDEGAFDVDLDDIDFQVLEQVAEAQAAAGGPGHVQLILNLQNEDDLEEMLGLLGPAVANANLNNIQFGFILDGVIDIQGVDAKRSRWVAAEDEDGHLSYTLKISID